MPRIRVLVRASDPVVRVGLGAILGTCADLDLVDETDAGVDVVVLAERSVGVGRLHALNQWRSGGGVNPACVVVTDQFDADSVLLAVRLGVKSVVPASSATESLLVAAVTGATQGISLLPPDLQAALLRKLAEVRSTVLEANGLSTSMLDSRECDVLSSVAAGLNVVEIAARIGCPERAVRNTLRKTMDRLNLKNHSHAVAYAVRSGAVA